MKKLSLCVFALLASSACALSAPTFSFVADLDVSGLSFAPNGPFFLDLALTQGDGSVINSVTFSDFSFTGGAATGAAHFFGNASGDFSGNVALNNNGGVFSSEMFQGFSSSTTHIRFTVTTTQNLGASASDCIAISILDSEPGNLPIWTDAPDTTSLINLSITGANSRPDIASYSGVAPTPVLTAVTVVPEPSAYGVIGAAALGLAALRRRRVRA